MTSDNSSFISYSKKVSELIMVSLTVCGAVNISSLLVLVAASVTSVSTESDDLLDSNNMKNMTNSLEEKHDQRDHDFSACPRVKRAVQIGKQSAIGDITSGVIDDIVQEENFYVHEILRTTSHDDDVKNNMSSSGNYDDIMIEEKEDNNLSCCREKDWTEILCSVSCCVILGASVTIYGLMLQLYYYMIASFRRPPEFRNMIMDDINNSDDYDDKEFFYHNGLSYCQTSMEDDDDTASIISTSIATTTEDHHSLTYSVDNAETTSQDSVVATTNLLSYNDSTKTDVDGEFSIENEREQENYYKKEEESCNSDFWGTIYMFIIFLISAGLSCIIRAANLLVYGKRSFATSSTATIGGEEKDDCNGKSALIQAQLQAQFAELKDLERKKKFEHNLHN